MCMVRLSPGAMSPRLQDSTWLPADPLMLQEPAAGCRSMDQSTPLPAGSGSLRVTARAMPVSAASLLDTVIVKPTGSPVLTGLASAVLTTLSSGARITIEPLPLAGLPLLGVAVAVLGSVRG